jgi:Family of unknown function (DUF6687)
MATRHTTPNLRLLPAGGPEAATPHLSVDGMSPEGPNLSHWPGNRTPRKWKADLSTGICLNFSRAPATDQREFLGSVTGVLNDHYDTDGFLSLLAVLRPEVAMEHEERCLLAAATGDFQAFQTWRGFAIDRIVLNLADPQRSPHAAAFESLTGAARDFERYRWLLEHAPSVLAEPERYQPLYADELAQVQEQLRAARSGAVDRRLWPEHHLAVVTSTEDLHRLVLNTVAGAYRVLHVRQTPEGPLYRYHDRTETWFEVCTFSPPRRRDLAELRTRLQRMEDGQDAGQEGAWCSDPATEPVPELYHGLPSGQAYGQITRTLTPSGLAPECVIAAVLEHFA